jgi:multidrug efflux pump subunit AcrA (membrane-fusion protein)
MSFDSKKSKLLGAFVGAILIIGSIYAVFFVDWGKDKALEPQLVRPLKMVRVGETSLPAVREYPGKVTAKDTVVLAFQVEGQVVELPVLKGPLKRNMSRPMHNWTESNKRSIAEQFQRRT